MFIKIMIFIQRKWKWVHDITCFQIPPNKRRVLQLGGIRYLLVYLSVETLSDVINNPIPKTKIISNFTYSIIYCCLQGQLCDHCLWFWLRWNLTGICRITCESRHEWWCYVIFTKIVFADNIILWITVEFIY